MLPPYDSTRTPRGIAATVAVLALALGGIVAASPAIAADTTLTVSTTADGDANDACTTSTIVTPASPTTLRNALCVASNLGGSSTVEVPQGTYALTDGALVLGTKPGTDVQLDATGGEARIVGDGGSQLLTIDAELVGDVHVGIDGFVFEGGRDSEYGGGAIIGGSYSSPTSTLVIANTRFVDNESLSGAANPGGAIQFIGGDLTITDSAFEENSSHAASGGAVFYEGTESGDDLIVTGSTFTDNSVTPAGGVSAGGGAIAFKTTSSHSVVISDSSFTDNSVAGSGSTGADGGAVLQVSGPATITGNRFVNNVATGAGAVHANSGAIELNYNSFHGNTGSSAVSGASAAQVNATNNWWGCNTGSSGTGCDTAILAAGTTVPHLTLTAQTSAPSITPPATATLTASLLTNSAGESMDPAKLGAFDDAVLNWTNIAPAGATLTPTTSGFTGGEATAVYTPGSAFGEGGARAALDGASVPVAITIRQAAHFVSPDTINAVAGQPFTFTVAAGGYPAPVVRYLDGDGPAGVSVFVNGGNVVISGVPSGAPHNYQLRFTATNTEGSATQTVTLAVGTIPAFASTSTFTIADGDELDATITATGTPTPTIAPATSVPAGLTLTDNGDGTARLHGTPTDPPGQYVFTLTATSVNGVSLAPFVLSITADPAFTSPASTTFTAGTAGSFDIVVTPGHPVTTAVSLGSGAPSWLGVTGVLGSQRLVGIPPAGSGGVVEFDLVVNGTITQRFTLTIAEAPVVIVNPVATSVTAGTPVRFTASATGHPAPAQQWQRFVAGSWTDIAGETSSELSLSTTTIADDGARFRATFTNSTGTTTGGEARLTVGVASAITPTAPLAVLAGAAVNVTITSSGHPVSALTAAGLPSWLTFTDAGDGTAVLSGTPGLTDAGPVEVTVTADNGFGVATSTVRVSVAAEVPLPYDLPASNDGPLTGVPASVLIGQQLTIGGDGFLPGAVVRLGIYSTPTSLGTAVADADGAFSAVVTIRTGIAGGAHTIAASGIGAGGTARLLASDTAVIVPSSGGGSSAGGGGPSAGGGGSSGDALAVTGADSSGSTGAALLALTAVLGGLVLLRRRRTV